MRASQKSLLSRTFKKSVCIVWGRCDECRLSSPAHSCLYYPSLLCLLLACYDLLVADVYLEGGCRCEWDSPLGGVL